MLACVKRRIAYITASIAILFGLLHFHACSSGLGRPTKYIVYVGFNVYTQPEKPNPNNTDTLNVALLYEYATRLNESGKYPVYFDTLVYECNFDAARIRGIYEKIAANPDVALVIDNTWGKHILNAEQLIREHNIPVIALSADQNSLDFGNNALFLSPSDPQPFYLIRYIREVLHTRSVGLISETDYLLHGRYDTLLRQNDVQAKLLVALSQKVYTGSNIVPAADSLRLVRQLDQLIPNLTDSVLLFNVHSGYGNVLLHYFQKNPLKNKTIVGLQQAARLPLQAREELTRRGCKFITFDVDEESVPMEVYRDWKTFKEKYPGLFRRSNARTLLWRMHDAINIAEAVWAKNMHADRAVTASYFQSFRNRKLLHNQELYAFDSLQMLKKSPLFNQMHRGGLLVTSPTQINPNGDSMPNIRVGIDILDINDIDLRNNSFNCNLRYWVIAHRKNIDKETYINFSTLIKADEAQIERISERIEGENVVRMYQVSGRFFNRYETSSFPLDWQEVVLPVSTLASSDELKTSFDDRRLGENEKLKAFSFNDWEPRQFYVTVDNQISKRLGTIEQLDDRDSTSSLEKYKNFNVHLVVKRQWWGALTLIILPFLMFSLLPIFLLFSVNLTFSNVGETIMSTFIAAVAYSINLVQISPTTDSLNRAYLLLLLTLAVNSICLLFVAFVDKRANSSKRQREEIDRLRRVFPFVMMGVFLVAFYFIFR